MADPVRFDPWNGKNPGPFRVGDRVCIPFGTYGSLVFQGGSGNRQATFSYKSGGRSQSSRRRFCTSVKGDNSA